MKFKTFDEWRKEKGKKIYKRTEESNDSLSLSSSIYDDPIDDCPKEDEWKPLTGPRENIYARVEDGKVLVDQLVRFVPVHVGKGFIHEEQFAVGIGDGDTFGALLDGGRQKAETRLDLPALVAFVLELRQVCARVLKLLRKLLYRSFGLTHELTLARPTRQRFCENGTYATQALPEYIRLPTARKHALTRRLNDRTRLRAKIGQWLRAKEI